MAKMKPKDKMLRKGLHFRKVASYVDVGRKPADLSGKGAFMACVQIGAGKFLNRVDRLGACASGKNPRKAIAAALRKAATDTSRRGGAFAGLFDKPRNRTR